MQQIDTSIYPSVYSFMSEDLSKFLRTSATLSVASTALLHNKYLSVHVSSYTSPECIPNPGEYWLNMDPVGVTFGTTRLRLDTIWSVLGVFLVSLGVILETLGSVLGCLGHQNLAQSGPECHLDSQGCFCNHFRHRFVGFCYSCMMLNGFIKWCSRMLR